MAKPRDRAGARQDLAGAHCRVGDTVPLEVTVRGIDFTASDSGRWAWGRVRRHESTRASGRPAGQLRRVHRRPAHVGSRHNVPILRPSGLPASLKQFPLRTFARLAYRFQRAQCCGERGVVRSKRVICPPSCSSCCRKAATCALRSLGTPARNPDAVDAINTAPLSGCRTCVCGGRKRCRIYAVGRGRGAPVRAVRSLREPE